MDGRIILSEGGKIKRIGDSGPANKEEGKKREETKHEEQKENDVCHRTFDDTYRAFLQRLRGAEWGFGKAGRIFAGYDGVPLCECGSGAGF